MALAPQFLPFFLFSYSTHPCCGPQVNSLADKANYLDVCVSLRKQQDEEIHLSQQIVAQRAQLERAQVRGTSAVLLFSTFAVGFWSECSCTAYRLPTLLFPSLLKSSLLLPALAAIPRTTVSISLSSTRRMQAGQLLRVLAWLQAAHAKASASLRELEASSLDSSGARLLEALEDTVQNLRYMVRRIMCYCFFLLFSYLQAGPAVHGETYMSVLCCATW